MGEFLPGSDIDQLNPLVAGTLMVFNTYQSDRSIQKLIVFRLQNNAYHLYLSHID